MCDVQAEPLADETRDFNLATQGSLRCTLADRLQQIIATDLASRHCISRGNSADTRLNLKTDTRMVGIPFAS